MRHFTAYGLLHAPNEPEDRKDGYEEQHASKVCQAFSKIVQPCPVQQTEKSETEKTESLLQLINNQTGTPVICKSWSSPSPYASG